MTVVDVHLGPAVLESARAGRHNFFRLLAAAVAEAGWQVAFRPNTPGEMRLARWRRRPALVFGAEPAGRRMAVLRRAYLYPFWHIERSNDRAAWRLTRMAFDAGAVDSAAARDFAEAWRRRVLPPGLPGRAAAGSGHVLVALQGLLMRRRRFQQASPAEMLASVLEHEPARRIVVTLHPGERYSENERAMVEAFAAHPRVRLEAEGDLHRLLAAADYVVTQNSSVAFHGLFHRVPAVLFADAHFHHVHHPVASLGAAEAFRRARAGPLGDLADRYLHWFLQEGCINAGRAGAGAQVREHLRALGWRLPEMESPGAGPGLSQGG